MMWDYGFNHENALPLMGFGGGFIFTILFWGLIIYLVWKIINKNHSAETSQSPDSAMDILKQRYAKGEVTKKEFDQIKQDLQA